MEFVMSSSKIVDMDELHNAAMDLAYLADRAEQIGDLCLVKDLRVHAARLGAEAASKATTEPSRSILYRSAAWLASNAGMYEEAIQLAEIGLMPHPHGDIPKRVLHELEEARAFASSKLRISTFSEVSNMQEPQQIHDDPITGSYTRGRCVWS
jgi:hypothetical protein